MLDELTCLPCSFVRKSRPTYRGLPPKGTSKNIQQPNTGDRKEWALQSSRANAVNSKQASRLLRPLHGKSFEAQGLMIGAASEIKKVASAIDREETAFWGQGNLPHESFLARMKVW